MNAAKQKGLGWEFWLYSSVALFSGATTVYARWIAAPAEDIAGLLGLSAMVWLLLALTLVERAVKNRKLSRVAQRSPSAPATP